MSRRIPLLDLVFYGFVFYYFTINYFLYKEFERFSAQYFLYVIPASLFLVAFFPFLFTKYTIRTLTLSILLFIAVSISVLRLDYQTILSFSLLLATMIAILNSKIRIRVSVINWLFLFAVAGSIISFNFGTNPYGYLPNLNNIKELIYGGVGPRISLFPLIPESAFFSLFVILVNYYLNPSWGRFFYYFLGVYFLIFSGSRTALIILSFVILFEVTVNFAQFRLRLTYRLLNVFFIVTLLVTMNFKAMYVTLAQIDNELLRSLLLREQMSSVDSNSTEDTNSRMWIWCQHLKILANNPILGVGTFDFSQEIESVTMSFQAGTGSESFLTSWMARIGLSMVLFVFFIFLVQRKAMQERNRFQYSICLFLFIVMITYGSFMVPYNFMFILLVASMTNTNGSTILKSA